MLHKYIKVQAVADGDDDSSYKELFISVVKADNIHLRFKAKDVHKAVFQLVAEIVIGLVAWVELFLNFEKLGDIFHRNYIFNYGDDHQVSDLVGVILLFDRGGNKSFFHIVAYHGGGYFSATKGIKVNIYIFCRLFKIKSHIRQVTVFGKSEVFYRFCQFCFKMFVHKYYCSPHFEFVKW